MSFQDFGLSEPLLRAVASAGYTTPTPIQTRAIPIVLAGGDLIGCAQTGTGKTAAFALPILERMAAGRPQGRPIRVLVVSPTRELAAQIDESFRTYGKHLALRSTVIFGGVNQFRQVEALRHGVDILVATPGRLLDLCQQRYVRLDRVEVLVLDEADRMLDMGFLPDVRKIVAMVPEVRQTLLFSATMPREIAELAHQLLRSPQRVDVAPPATTVESVTQKVYLVGKEDKLALLEHLLADPAMSRALVFARTKHGAEKLAKKLERSGIKAAAIHGNKSQNARQRALAEFARGAVRVLVASDIASRGLDIDEVSHVINFDLPNEPETYVHRIGRTGRAGARGIAISFCAMEERGYLRAIEKTARIEVPVEPDHPFAATFSKMPQPGDVAPSQGRGGGGRGGSGRGGGGDRSGGRGPNRSGGRRPRPGGGPGQHRWQDAGRGRPERDGGGGRGPAPSPGGGGRGPAPSPGQVTSSSRGPAPSQARGPSQGGWPSASRGPSQGPSQGPNRGPAPRPSGGAPGPSGARVRRFGPRPR